MDKKQKKILVGAVILIAIVGIGLLITANTNKVERGPDQVVAAVGTHGGEPEGGFNSITGWGSSHESLVYSTLFKTDDEYKIVNDLAESYTVSDDSKIWTVQIKDNVKFSNNKSLTAEDVKFTYETAKKEGGDIDLSMLDKVNVKDKNTVEFVLNKPENSFIWKLRYLGIVSKDDYNKENYGEKPIGSGPYKLVQWNKGQQVIFDLNPNYYGKKPSIKKLTILYMETDAAFSAAKSGQVDIAEIPNSYVNEKIEGYKIKKVPSIDARGCSLPCVADTGNKTKEGYKIGNNVTSDIAIRKALNIGIDRNKLVEGALNGQGEPEYTGVDKLIFANPDAKVKDGDIEQAKKILDDAGWKDNDGDGIREKNGTKAEFDLLYDPGAPERQALATEVSELSAELGIKVNPKGASWDEVDTKKYSQAVLFGYGTLDPQQVYLQYHSVKPDDTYNNPSLMNNSKIDQYLERGISTNSESDAINNFKLAAYDGETGYGPNGECPWLWMATINYVYIVDEKLDTGTPGVQPHGADIFGNIYEWTKK